MELSAWKSQLRKGAAELAVLATLGRSEAYGLELLDRIHAAGGLDLSEGTIYPLLNRLQKDGKISGRWVDDPDATHPRKYYSLTDEGREFLAEMVAEWARFEAGMRELVGDGVGLGQRPCAAGGRARQLSEEAGCGARRPPDRGASRDAAGDEKPRRRAG